jgi:ABC-type dipeptide/oligopeptide/nickel transport system permease subunit
MKRVVWYLANFRDHTWMFSWICGILFLLIWNYFFLNKPAQVQVLQAFINTIIIGIAAVVLSLFQGWIFIQITYLAHHQGIRTIVLFFLNLVRSIPQIIGILFGYIILTQLLLVQYISGLFSTIILMSFIISIFIFLEIYDLFCERIDFFRRREFYNAMIVCGISEGHIINKEILFRSSFVHVLNKIISLFGIAVFLNCSIDFILSVGLSTEVSSVNLPTTLGSLLAQIDSKQDILAIGHSLTHWPYIIKLPFEHLQGISVAFLIVFTLLCFQRIANAYTRRNRL